MEEQSPVEVKIKDTDKIISSLRERVTTLIWQVEQFEKA